MYACARAHTQARARARALSLSLHTHTHETGTVDQSSTCVCVCARACVQACVHVCVCAPGKSRGRETMSAWECASALRAHQDVVALAQLTHNAQAHNTAHSTRQAYTMATSVWRLLCVYSVCVCVCVYGVDVAVPADVQHARRVPLVTPHHLLQNVVHLHHTFMHT